MYMDDYKRWLETDLEDASLTEELKAIAGQDEEIKERKWTWSTAPSSRS